MLLLWFSMLLLILCNFCTIKCILHPMRKIGIIPEIIDFEPNETLTVIYGRATRPKHVEMGNKFTAEEVQYAPTVRWKTEPNTLYTLMMVDPDVPGRNSLLRFGPFRHWLIGNIPGLELWHGYKIAAYYGAAPSMGTGVHRYVFLLYKQVSEMRFFLEKSRPMSRLFRRFFDVRDFAKDYELGQPIAGNFFVAEWDPSVNKIYDRVID